LRREKSIDANEPDSNVALEAGFFFLAERFGADSTRGDSTANRNLREVKRNDGKRKRQTLKRKK
jgi:hypothetical protein